MPRTWSRIWNRRWSRWGDGVRAEVKRITPNNRTLEWDDISPNVDPQADFASFYVNIGVEDDPPSDLFLVTVATAASASRARTEDESQYRGFLVKSFDRDEIVRTIRDYVSSVTGPDWSAIAEQLRQRLDWEYEGITPPLSKPGPLNG